MMSYQNVIGKYLYMAAIRQRANAWNKRYRILHKKQIYNHLIDMKVLVNLLESEDLDQIRSGILDYAAKYTEETPVLFDSEEYSEEYCILNQFMISLLDVSIKETTKLITDWECVAHKLDVFHNLPKVYLSSEKDGGCSNRLSIEDAYSFVDMAANDDEKAELMQMRLRHQHRENLNVAEV